MGFRCKGAEYNRLNVASATIQMGRKAMSTRDIILAHPVRTASGVPATGLGATT